MSYSTRRCLLKKSVKLSFLSLILLLVTFCSVQASEIRAVGYFPGEGIKAYTGNSWKSYNDALPSDLVAEAIMSDSKGTLYLTTEFSGIFRRRASDSQWINIASPLLRRRTQLAGVSEYRRISAFCIDPSDDNRLFIATKHTLYASTDAGASWKQIVITNNKNSYYFTSLAIFNGTLYAGTSFNGIIILKNGRAQEITAGIPKEYYAGTLHFCEGVSALTGNSGAFYSGYLFGRGFCVSSDATKWTPVPLPLKNNSTEGVYSIIPYNNKVFITTDESIYEYTPGELKAVTSPLVAEYEKTFFTNNPSLLYIRKTAGIPALFIKRNSIKYTIENINKAGNKRALYVSWSMIDKGFNRFLDIVIRNNFNAVIIDVKDDYGVINAPIESKIAKEIGAIRQTNIREIIEKLHHKGIYVIARNVTFKDKKLYYAYNSKYAIWDKVSNQAWVGLPREKWCDPYSQFVRDYNIEIARETAKLGFDEIQFDYIRFPTDGPTGRCLFRYKENADTFKSEILGDFLMQARKEVGVPVSVDIYGYNGWYRFGNLIGQDIEFLSRFVDAVCPMVYPSHFGSKFYNRYPVADRPYVIVLDSAVRGVYLSHNRTVIRPWIQDFNYASPTWGPDYILKQLKGIDDGGVSSYSFWNPSGDHSMADRALALSRKKK